MRRWGEKENTDASLTQISMREAIYKTMWRYSWKLVLTLWFYGWIWYLVLTFSQYQIYILAFSKYLSYLCLCVQWNSLVVFSGSLLPISNPALIWLLIIVTAHLGNLSYPKYSSLLLGNNSLLCPWSLGSITPVTQNLPLNCVFKSIRSQSSMWKF